MKKVFLSLLILFVCTLVQAQETNVEPSERAQRMAEQMAQLEAAMGKKPKTEESAPEINEAATEIEEVGSAWKDKYADQPYLALVTNYETVIKPDWSYEETYHARIKIQKNEAKELGQWPVYYNRSRDTIMDIQAHVEGPDGRRYPAGEIKDIAVYDDVPMYSDIRMKLVNLPQVEVGSIIEVTVRSVTKSKEIPNHFWTEILYPAIPTQKAKHIFIIPDDKPVQLKSYNTDYKPLIEKSGGVIKYTFAFEETKPIPNDEELMPPLQEVLGTMYLSSMSDWKVVADWYRGLVHKNTVEDTEITIRTLGLTKGKITQKDMARAILEFVQDNFRPIPMNFGDNTVEPHPTSDILKNRYGDSKDISLLLKQMFKIVGIDSNVCLFSGEYAGDPQNGLPSPSVFSAVILQANLDGQNYYVDPALKGYDFDHYPSSYDNATVFVITEDSYQFEHFPVAGAEEHTLISQVDVTVAPDGSADYRVHIKLPLETSQGFKNTWSTSNAQEKDKFFLNLEKNFAKNGKIIDRQITGVEGRYDQVELKFKYQAINAYPLVNDMLLIKEEDQVDMPDFVKIDRQNPIFLPNNSLVKNTNVYHVPEGFKIDSVPANYSLSIDFMDVVVNYSQKEDQVQIDSNYSTKRCTIPLKRYNQVRDFRKEVSQKNNQYVIFKKLSDISTEAKDWVKEQ